MHLPRRHLLCRSHRLQLRECGPTRPTRPLAQGGTILIEPRWTTRTGSPPSEITAPVSSCFNETQIPSSSSALTKCCTGRLSTVTVQSLASGRKPGSPGTTEIFMEAAEHHLLRVTGPNQLEGKDDCAYKEIRTPRFVLSTAFTKRSTWAEPMSVPPPAGPRWFWSMYGLNLPGPFPEGVRQQGPADHLEAAKLHSTPIGKRCQQLAAR